MTTITINLENEHVLAGTLQGLIESLSTEQFSKLGFSYFQEYIEHKNQDR